MAVAWPEKETVPSSAFQHDARKSEHNPGIFTEGWVVNSRGLRLRTYTACSWASPKGCIVCAHGITAHALYEILLPVTPGGRVKKLEGSVAELFLDMGLALYTWDLEGHGLSDSVGGPGYFASTWGQAEDLLLIAKLVRKERPGLPVFGFGVSMGGGLNIGAAIKEPQSLDGLVLSAPMVSVERVLKKGANQALAQIAPCVLTLCPCVGRLRLVGFPEPSSKDMKHSKELDPLVYQGYVLRAGPAFSNLGFCKDITEKAGQLNTPFLTLHAREDPFTDYASSELLQARAATTDKTFLEAPPGSEHIYLCEEVSREWARQAVAKWLKARCP